jgi:fatty acid desaturase
MYQISAPTASLWTTSSVNFTLSYFSMSIARKSRIIEASWSRILTYSCISVNVLLTIMISARLFMLSRQVRDAMGKDHAKPFISLAAIAIESAAPYALCGLIFIITFAKNNAAQNVMLPILSQVMVCLIPNLNILPRLTYSQSASAPSLSFAESARIRPGPRV